MKLTADEAELIREALYLFANWIETGNVNLSAADKADRGESIKPLEKEQMDKVSELRRLSDVLRLYSF